ncbi:uncharacterized protein HD556DRAFT_1310912 [Suillus plorans]|uniref:Uncharacterized protein n=1 Tax=Suillus plorans TaxID=116603 RepID=A0A9P7DDS8_9AGAM|nr:uncharacterized protein HD556DRAFT_1310912 [Suillus plorans]KAG1790128.1 hypothetical protein HD556DRAFT_1310912 [Suillus plorans]
MSGSLSPTNSLDREILSCRSLNDAIEAISNPARCSQVQTTAYLLGARQELPEFFDEDVADAHADICGSTYIVRIPQHTTDPDIATVYVDVGFAENTLPSDVFDCIHAYMDISPEDSELGWQLSTDRRSDPPAHLKTSFDLKNAFQSARAKRYSGRKEKHVKIEILNLKSISKIVSAKQGGKNSHLSNVSAQPITSPSPTVHNYIHLRGKAADQNQLLHAGIKCLHDIYLKMDNESDDEPQLPICNVLDIIDPLFPAMDFHWYLGALHRQGIAYLASAVNFDCNFYVNKMRMKNDRAVARQKAKGKKFKLPSENPLCVSSYHHHHSKDYLQHRNGGYMRTPSVSTPSETQIQQLQERLAAYESQHIKFEDEDDMDIKPNVEKSKGKKCECSMDDTGDSELSVLQVHDLVFYIAYSTLMVLWPRLALSLALAASRSQKVRVLVFWPAYPTLMVLWLRPALSNVLDADGALAVSRSHALAMTCSQMCSPIFRALPSMSLSTELPPSIINGFMRTLFPGLFTVTRRETRTRTASTGAGEKETYHTCSHHATP